MLLRGIALVLCNTVLGNNMVNIVLAGGADGTGGKNGAYLADGAALGSGGKGNNRTLLGCL